MTSITEPVMYGLSTLDLILAGCMCVLAAINVTTPVKCKHPCANCAAERAEAQRLAQQREAEAEERGTTYNHDLGLDRRWCVLCRSIHCPHEGCQRTGE